MIDEWGGKRRGRMMAKGESRSKDVLIRKLIMMEDDGWEEEERGKIGGDKAGKVDEGPVNFILGEMMSIWGIEREVETGGKRRMEMKGKSTRECEGKIAE